MPSKPCKRVKPDNYSIGRSGNRGFTLIELLLVLVILTILAAIVVPRYAKRSEQARITAASTDIASLEAALDLFEVDAGRYPSTEEGLEALVEVPAQLENWKGPYIKRGVPKDPWGNPYVYTSPGDNNSNSYDLYSYGPDGKDGGDDDIDNWSER
ncbi:MAG TPA: type II secretion system major pseudopilin GspG [bacterium]|uniref:Type II secretion system core protein G n=1 Tax=candidate division TA06 bacterium ADurb.Bin417 TaxID=1852828 RepID=A0A1V5MDF7_UNCT6|nr:MAG: Type II secretion system protein G precursor [candidate division TA06 bacterium ADurb.Bin417]HNQ34835.1 type II secretion system major pseudopilin GspG [bacterium]HNS49124.1 type II secretion system major pseudopilin GspG [bacterium]